MKRALKIICKVLMWTVVAVVALLLLSPFWIGPVGKVAANAVVPKITGTAFNLGELSLNPYTGTLHVGKVRLENPEGFSDREAVTLDKLDVKVSMASIFTKKILVEEVAISGVYATYVSHDGRNNFEVIAENASGGPKAEEDKKAEEAAKAEAPKADAAKEKAKAGESEAEDGGKKVEIARLSISGVKVKVEGVPVTIPVPPITLTDIGKESGGATLAEIWQQILAVAVKSCGALGDALFSLGAGVVDGVSAVGGAAVEAAGAAAGAAVEAAGAAAGAVGDAAGAAADAAKSVGGAAADAAGAAAGAVGDAVKGTGNMIKGLFK